MASAGPWFWTVVKEGGKGRSSWKAGDRVFARVTGSLAYQVWDGRKKIGSFSPEQFDRKFETSRENDLPTFCLDQRYICRSFQKIVAAKGAK